MTTPPPDLDQPHLAIGLHFKRFPGRDEVWHNQEQRWYPLAEFDTHVRIYDDRVRGWFLDCASRLPHDGFVVLMIAVAYFEGNEHYRVGRVPRPGESGRFFRDGFARAFPELSGTPAVQTFYEDVRCGLFHDGITRERIRISNSLPDAVAARRSLRSASPAARPRLRR